MLDCVGRLCTALFYAMLCCAVACKVKSRGLAACRAYRLYNVTTAHEPILRCSEWDNITIPTVWSLLLTMKMLDGVRHRPAFLC